MDPEITATEESVKKQPQGFSGGVTRFYSRIADRSALANTWHYIRGLDNKGSGWISFSLSKAAATLKVTISTIRRHLREGKKEGFINWFKTTGDTATACYVSRDKVCRRLGLEEWGAVAEVFLHDLPASKELSAELEAISRQKSSQCLAKKESKRPPLKIDKLLKPSLNAQEFGPSKWGNSAGIFWIGDRFTFVSSDFVSYGASQAGIGEQMQRCDRTIKRRLSNFQRDKKGLEPLQRKQIAKEILHPESLEVYMKLYEKPGKIFTVGDKTFMAGCNVYNPQYNLISMRTARRVFSRFRGDRDRETQITGAVTRDKLVHVEEVAFGS